MPGLDKFTSAQPIFRTCAPGRARKKIGAQNQSQCACLVEKQLEAFIFILCYLNRACGFCFYRNSIKSFCNKAFAL